MKFRVAVILGVLLLVAMAAALFFSSRPRPAPLPSPNGYDDLVSVIPTMVPNPGYWCTQDIGELRAVLGPNSNALATIRGALKKEWAVPVSYDTNYLSSMFANLAMPKALATLFCAEGHLAELEQRTNDALNAFADCIQLGEKTTHGALIIHDLVGIACQAIGRQAARTSWPAVDDSSLHMFLNRLGEIDQSNHSAEEVIRRDQDWARRTYGLRFIWESLTQWPDLRAGEDGLRAAHLRSKAELRLLRADVAMELFRRESGHYPDHLDTLVPRYLEAVPIDPFSGKQMRYRLTTNSYLLYSIGPDRKDDGGRSLTKSTQDQGDLVSTPPLHR